MQNYLCFIVFYNGMVSAKFTHILQGYFIWLPQYQWINPEGYGKCTMWVHWEIITRTESRLAPSQREMSLQVSHWLGTNLESALDNISKPKESMTKQNVYFQEYTVIHHLVELANFIHIIQGNLTDTGVIKWFP